MRRGGLAWMLAVVGWALAACTPEVAEELATHRVEVELDRLLEREVLVVYDNHADNGLGPRVLPGARDLLAGMSSPRRAWRVGWVSAYPPPQDVPPRFLGEGFVDDRHPAPSAESALEDTTDAGPDAHRPLDALLGFLESDAFADFHSPDATLYIHLIAGRDDASDVRVRTFIERLEVLDIWPIRAPRAARPPSPPPDTPQPTAWPTSRAWPT